jgi:MarR family transcriptional regulator for hemolysin
LLDRLEAKGWVERRADPNDRRAKRVCLTGEVQGLMRALRTIARDLRLDAMDGVDEAERQRFVDTLLVIKANLVRMNGNGHGHGSGSWAGSNAAGHEGGDDRASLARA